MSDPTTMSHAQLQAAIEQENSRFAKCYRWLEQAMPSSFFKEVPQENLRLICHSLVGFHLQDDFSQINLHHSALVLCLDSADADIRILKPYKMYGIKNYRSFTSKIPLPESHEKLRVGLIHFVADQGEAYEEEEKRALYQLMQEKSPDLSEAQLQMLLNDINPRFVRALPKHMLALALDMFLRAQTRDHCQYEERYNEDWQERDLPSVEIMLAWRNTPKANFLYRLAKLVYRHGLVMTRVNAAYVHPLSRHPILMMRLGLDGAMGQAAWQACDWSDFLKELATLKYFDEGDEIDRLLVSTKVISGNQGNFLRALITFVHQVLLNIDPHLYSVENIEEALLRHVELTAQLCLAFESKFHPQKHQLATFLQLRDGLQQMIAKIDTGKYQNDVRRKNIFKQSLSFIDHILKTNFYRNNKAALSFRLDPAYLDHMGIDRQPIFPELPYAIFYIKGMHYFGFHVRFRDLARGGLRTVFPDRLETMLAERHTVFSECYHLAYTQHKKNKDIPEGGAKGVIFLSPADSVEVELAILSKESQHIDAVKEKLAIFKRELLTEYLHHAQRSYIESLMSLIHCLPNGQLLAKDIVDYWQKPEYLYLGPDENMHDEMIDWIAAFSQKNGYKAGGSFISGRPKAGVNHKQWGVTSLGVNVYMVEVLHHLGIDPEKEPFTVKLTGGPDGDVAGNQILNLYRFFPKTAKLLCLIDGSGTIYDPSGLDLAQLATLFQAGLAIKHYPPQLLNEGGFLLDKSAKREVDSYTQQTLCLCQKGGELVEEWLASSEVSYLLNHNVHGTFTDVFIPAGGRPRTIDAANVSDFLDSSSKPTARAIIEGANLYFSPQARSQLEALGVLIVKDSSANKCGVICSSFEILSSLALKEELFLQEKDKIVQEILERLKTVAQKEAKLLLSTHQQTGQALTLISDQISAKINLFKYQILDYLETLAWPADPIHPLNICFKNYCLPTLKEKYSDLALKEIPASHKKAIVACYLAANIVYEKGVQWQPSIVDILPLIMQTYG